MAFAAGEHEIAGDATKSRLFRQRLVDQRFASHRVGILVFADCGAQVAIHDELEWILLRLKVDLRRSTVRLGSGSNTTAAIKTKARQTGGRGLRL